MHRCPQRLEVLKSCEESGPVPALDASSSELDGGRSDMVIAWSPACCSLFWAKVEAISDGSSAAILGEMTGKLAVIISIAACML